MPKTLKAGFVQKQGKWLGSPQRHMELTEDSLLFRKAPGGPVRRQLELKNIKEVRISVEDDDIIELVTPERAWIVRTNTSGDRDDWFRCLDDASKVAWSKFSSPQRRWSSAGGAGGGTPMDAAATPSSPAPMAAPLSVTMVSVHSGPGQPEVIVRRDPPMNAELPMAALAAGGSLLLTLSSGDRILVHGAELARHPSGKPFWAESGGVGVQLQATSLLAPPPSSSSSSSSSSSGDKDKESALRVLSSSRAGAGLALGFLVACGVYVFSVGTVHADALTVTMALGGLLAFQVIIQNVTAPKKRGRKHKRGRSGSGSGATGSLKLLAVRAASTAVDAAAETVVEEEEEENEAFERFVRGCMGDLVEANRRWDITVRWREENNVDAILQEPQPHYEIIKKHYPHWVHKFDKLGHPVYFERPGYVDLKSLKKNGVGLQELLRHYLFITENLWNNIAPSEEAKTMTVLDVSNIGIRDLAGDVFEFIRGASHFVQEHYPERSFKIVIINVPLWFSTIWKLIQPLINEVTRQKITIMRSGWEATLLELIDPENLPVAYGGTCDCDGDCRMNSPQERAQSELVASITPEPVVEQQ